MNRTIKVSVIVPVYNAEEYLNRCVDSLLNQTLKDIEIILVDDGSKDLSPQICDEYVDYLEIKNNSSIVSFNFRDKTNGWIESGPKIEFSNGKIKRWPLYEDTYMQGYFSAVSAVCMKNSCYTYKYKNFHSGSDVAIADYWGAKILILNFMIFMEFYLLRSKC